MTRIMIESLSLEGPCWSQALWCSILVGQSPRTWPMLKAFWCIHLSNEVMDLFCSPQERWKDPVLPTLLFPNLVWRNRRQCVVEESWPDLPGFKPSSISQLQREPPVFSFYICKRRSLWCLPWGLWSRWACSNIALATICWTLLGRALCWALDPKVNVRSSNISYSRSLCCLPSPQWLPAGSAFSVIYSVSPSQPRPQFVSTVCCMGGWHHSFPLEAPREPGSCLFSLPLLIQGLPRYLINMSFCLPWVPFLN